MCFMKNCRSSFDVSSKFDCFQMNMFVSVRCLLDVRNKNSVWPITCIYAIGNSQSICILYLRRITLQNMFSKRSWILFYSVFCESNIVFSGRIWIPASSRFSRERKGDFTKKILSQSLLIWRIVFQDTRSGCKRGFISIKGDRAADNDQNCGNRLSSVTGDDQNGIIHCKTIRYIVISTRSQIRPRVTHLQIGAKTSSPQ